jgi:hypothetical protein
MGNKLPKIRRITFTVTVIIAVIIVLSALFALITHGGETVFYIKPNDLHPLDNPYMGYVSTDVKTPTDLTYIELTWAEFEPKEGRYDFEGFEYRINYEELRSSGKRVVFRFLSDRPGQEEHMDIPEWLYDIAGGEYYDNEYGKGFSPNYASLKFMQYHQKTIAALGDRYGSDDFFAFIEIGSVGHNGNFEVSDDIDISIDKYVLENYVEDYLDNFKNSILLTPGSSYFTEEYGLGEYIPDLSYGFGDFTKNRVYGAHIIDTSSDYAAALDGKGISYLVSESRPSDETLSKIGYVLKVIEASAITDTETGDLTADITFTNSGTAPFPAKEQPVLYVVNSRGKVLVKFPLSLDLDTIRPGEQISVSKTINLSAFSNERTFRLCVGVQDSITNEPFVTFAMEDELLPMVYYFGSVTM